MSRSFSGPVLSALQADNIPHALLIELDFISGVLRLASSATPISWNGQTWHGAGLALDVDVIEEAADLQAPGVTISLSGIPSQYLARARDESCQGRPATIYFAVLDSSYAPLVDPFVLWRGRMDNMPISIGQTAAIAVRCESRLMDWDIPQDLRYNDASQQARFPGDLLFQYTEVLSDKEDIWGLPNAAS